MTYLADANAAAMIFSCHQSSPPFAARETETSSPAPEGVRTKVHDSFLNFSLKEMEVNAPQGWSAQTIWVPKICCSCLGGTLFCMKCSAFGNEDPTLAQAKSFFDKFPLPVQVERQGVDFVFLRSQ